MPSPYHKWWFNWSLLDTGYWDFKMFPEWLYFAAKVENPWDKSPSSNQETAILLEDHELFKCNMMYVCM